MSTYSFFCCSVWTTYISRCKWCTCWCMLQNHTTGSIMSPRVWKCCKPSDVAPWAGTCIMTVCIPKRYTSCVFSTYHKPFQQTFELFLTTDTWLLPLSCAMMVSTEEEIFRCMPYTCMLTKLTLLLFELYSSAPLSFCWSYPRMSGNHNWCVMLWLLHNNQHCCVFWRN